VQLQFRRHVLWIVSTHAFQQADVVCDFCKMRQQIGHGHAALASRFYRDGSSESQKTFRSDLQNRFTERGIQRLAVSLLNEGFGVEQIHL